MLTNHVYAHLLLLLQPSVLWLSIVTFNNYSGAFFLPEIFEKVNFDPYHFRITILSARKSEQMENF